LSPILIIKVKLIFFCNLTSNKKADDIYLTPVPLLNW
jgi:hypothetical protein